MYQLFVILFIITHCDSSPDQLDWRTSGAVLPVPEQTKCGDHPAVINAMDAISAKIKIRGGPLVKLSRTQIYECSDDWCPCDPLAANVTQVYQLIEAKNISHGLQTENSRRMTDTCEHKCVRSLTNYTLDSYVSSPDDVYLEENLSCWLVSGPVAVNIDADCVEFKQYQGGILTEASCGGSPNHVLLLIGYGTQTGVDYWIARNSWGVGWGEQGYIRIGRGKNLLGIGNGFTLPL